MRNKYFYPIFKLKTKSWIRYWLLKKTEFKGKLSEILSGFTFNLQNTLRQKFVKFEIQGHSEQESTSISDGDEYDSPSPEHEQPIKSAGENVNLFDKDNGEQGAIDASGNYVDNNTNWRAIDFIKVNPNTIYSFSIDRAKITTTNRLRIYEYSQNKNFISPRKEGILSQDFTFTTGQNTEYIKYTIYIENETMTSNIINSIKPKLEQGSIATPYSPFGMGSITEKITNADGTEEQTYSIYTQQPFRSIGDVRDEFVKKDGKWYERHYIGRYIFTGNENIIANITDARKIFYMFLDDKKTGLLPLKCNILNYSSTGWNTTPNNSICVESTNTAIFMRIDSFNTLTDLKTYLAEKYANGTPVYVDYESQEPTLLLCTQEQIDILENIPITYEGQTNVYSTDEVQPYLKIQYWESDTND